MKPLRKGAARTALGEHLKDLLNTAVMQATDESFIASSLTADQIGAIIGGAVDQSLTDMFGPEQSKDIRPLFWRYTSHNLWNLIRSLRASNQLEKV